MCTHKLNKRSTLSLFSLFPFHFFCFLFCFITFLILHHRRGTFVAHGYQNMGLQDLRDRCDGNIKMKLNDVHACALIVDLRVRILRICLQVGF